MKIVHINCTFNIGSTGKIVAALYDYSLQKGDEAFAIYGIGDINSNENIFKCVPWAVRKLQSLRSRITGYPYGGCIWGTWSAIHILKSIKPDIVHIHCINGYILNIYKLLDYLKKSKIPTVITNHAEFMYTGGCTHAIDCKKWETGCYKCDKISKEHPISYFFDRTEKEWQLLQKAYDGFEKLSICCVSDWVRNRAIRSPFFSKYPVLTVLNGLDTDVFHYIDSSGLKAKLGLQGKRIIVHATPNFYNVIKGGYHVLEIARRFPELEFVIIGSEAKGKIPNNCHFVGPILDQNLLAMYYSMAELCLLTSVRETFSMVCAESLCCGTAVVGFKAGGPETIAIPQYSTFVEQGNDDLLENALKEMLEKHYDKQELSDIAVKKYSKNTMCDNYYKVYYDVFN
ncbi:MAG: glycosyltransferase [Erysipelotrichaceae bacterium]|nr:glycosyltransferase [Erysipelotrichaceae bacterium]